jgi:glycosyltransferase involved in cell wall biosynthesis
MRVGFNLLYLLPGVVGGTQTYAESLIRALVDLGEDDEYVLYVNREAADGLDVPEAANVRTVVCGVTGTRRPLRYGYEQLLLPRHVSRDGVDVLHSLGYVGPLRAPCPHVVTVHDLIYVGFKDHMSARRRWALQVFVRGVARRADRIITVSESSKAQIVADVGLHPDRVAVIHEAGRPLPAPGTLRDPAVPAGHGIDRPYIVAFSSLSPSKNIPRLIEAFEQVADCFDGLLVLIGHLPLGGTLEARIDQSPVADRIISTGYVPDDDVLPLVAQSRVFAMPSVYEGFGLPVLDAQAAEVPVVCSDAASLPEVAGEGALLFDPSSTAELASALRRVLTDDRLRRDLVEAGSTNLQRFSWERAAKETRQIHLEVVGR